MCGECEPVLAAAGRLVGGDTGPAAGLGNSDGGDNQDDCHTISSFDQRKTFLFAHSGSPLN